MFIVRVILAEDWVQWQAILERWVTKAVRELYNHVEIKIFGNFSQAWTALESKGPWHLLITDIALDHSMSEHNLGTQLIALANDQQIPCIVVSGSAVIDTLNVHNLILNLKTNGFFSKGHLDVQQFTKSVQDIIKLTIANFAQELTSKIESFFNEDQKTTLSKILKNLTLNELDFINNIIFSLENSEQIQPELQNILTSTEELFTLIKLNKYNFADSKMTLAVTSLSEFFHSNKTGIKHKIKFLLPIIPIILSYQAEIELGGNFKDIILRIRESWKRLFS